MVHATGKRCFVSCLCVTVHTYRARRTHSARCRRATASRVSPWDPSSPDAESSCSSLIPDRGRSRQIAVRDHPLRGQAWISPPECPRKKLIPPRFRRPTGPRPRGSPRRPRTPRAPPRRGEGRPRPPAAGPRTAALRSRVAAVEISRSDQCDIKCVSGVKARVESRSWFTGNACFSRYSGWQNRRYGTVRGDQPKPQGRDEFPAKDRGSESPTSSASRGVVGT